MGKKGNKYPKPAPATTDENGRHKKLISDVVQTSARDNDWGIQMERNLDLRNID